MIEHQLRNEILIAVFRKMILTASDSFLHTTNSSRLSRTVKV
jgi:hypothetical protein